MMNKKLFLFMGIVLLHGSLFAQNPFIDSTFGTNGFVLVDFSNKIDEVYGMRVQSDGKILLAGTGWALAIPLGCVLRGLIRGYAPPLPFVVVAMVATLVLLCAGRVAFSVLEDFFVELV